jgi:hypothetical protein
MWIAKGLLLGLWFITFGSITWFYVAIYRKLPPGPGMFSPNLLTHLTVSNPVWWLWLVACLSIALIITHAWPGRTILWVGLAVTELVPVGLFAFILVTMNQVPGFRTDPDWAKKGQIIQKISDSK